MNILKSIYLYFFIFINLAHADFQTFSTNSIEEFRDQVFSHSSQCGGKENILVVFDVDDTLVKNDYFLGGREWFRLQKRYLQAFEENQEEGQYSVSGTEGFWGIIQATWFLRRHPIYGQTSPVEDKTARVFSTLDSHHDTIVITARSEIERPETRQSLDQAQIRLQAVPHLSDIPTSKPLWSHGKAIARDISFKDGLMLVAGQDKGQLLKGLLDKNKKQYQCIFFLDDTKKNISHMNEAFENDQNTKAFTFHYTNVEEQTTHPEKIDHLAIYNEYFQAVLSMLESDSSRVHELLPIISKPLPSLSSEMRATQKGYSLRPSPLLDFPSLSQ